MTALYYLHGRRITKDEALDANGALRNHVVMRVPQFMRDGRPNPRLSDMQRSVAGSHRPLVEKCPGRPPDSHFVSPSCALSPT
jgi:hypothetical protein